MNVKSVEKKEKSTVELLVEVGKEEFEAAIEKVYKKQRGRINIPGFRKGHAPRKVIEGMYGAEVFYEDAINEAYPDAYTAAVEQEKLDVVGYPTVNVVNVDENGFSFTALVPVRPEVKLGEYKGLSAVKEDASVTDADLEEEMGPLVERASRWVSVDRAAEDGDTVNMNYKGYKDGVAFVGGEAEKYDLEIGSGEFIPGFEPQLIGMKAGDERKVTVTFPKAYQSELLAGQEAVFDVKVNEVKMKVKPTVDDEFAKDVSEFETLEELKKNLSEKIKTRKEKRAQDNYRLALLDAATANMECEIPESMIEMEAQKIFNDFGQSITSAGMALETYLEMTGMDEATLQDQARTAARRQVRNELLLDAIAKAEGVEVTDEECENEIAKMAEQYTMEADEVRKLVDPAELKNQIRNRKAAEFVYSTAVEGKPAKKTTKKAAAKKTEEPAAEEKPAKKTTKKAAAKKDEAPAEEKPAKKTTKKAAAKKDEAPAEEKPAPKKRTTKKAEPKPEE